MDYVIFTTCTVLVLITSIIIYSGCRRSCSIYFFEVQISCVLDMPDHIGYRDAKKVLFLGDGGAIAVPIVLSVLLIILYRNLKLSADNEMEEKIAEQKRQKSRTSSVSHQLAGKRLSKLDSISESAVADKMKTEFSDDLPEKRESVDDSSLEKDSVNNGIRSNSSGKDVMGQLNNESGNIGEATPADEIRRKSLSSKTARLRRRSSILSDDELVTERKRSEIYKKMGKVAFFPSVDEIVTVMNCPSLNMSKQTILNVLSRLITFHVPLWLGVIAVQIILVEVFDSKFCKLWCLFTIHIKICQSAVIFFNICSKWIIKSEVIIVLESILSERIYWNHIFYYHNPKMRQLAIIIALLLGIFQEVKWTWVVNDILSIATSYVIIARTEVSSGNLGFIKTASYFAGFLFLVGMILFDLFWFYCVDLFSVVTGDPRSPIMLVIPLGKKRRPVKISIVDIVVPGIFLNIVLKFAEMYDSGVFILSFYACIFGLFVTELITLLRQKSTPAMVIPGIFTILVSLLSVDSPSDLWRFGIKH
uniref:Dolichol kinase n=1 Tax=Elaeophora elaphi TaxID=1147741 RepID=A0A0R3S3M9_9BILA